MDTHNKDDIGDMSFDMVFKQPTLTPDREDVAVRREKNIKKRKKPALFKKTPTFEQYMKSVEVSSRKKNGGRVRTRKPSLRHKKMQMLRNKTRKGRKTRRKRKSRSQKKA